ncbi:MAG: hypothetical protein BWX45_00730 [Deltaproteobacteria bacterium ADurb.Bin002]|nr:MAG: hypothetical protein BWX45_00730 [Deltaproteobacteria bacterium ADurb.Bin002]
MAFAHPQTIGLSGNADFRNFKYAFFGLRQNAGQDGLIRRNGEDFPVLQRQKGRNITGEKNDRRRGDGFAEIRNRGGLIHGPDLLVLQIAQPLHGSLVYQKLLGRDKICMAEVDELFSFLRFGHGGRNDINPALRQGVNPFIFLSAERRNLQTDAKPAGNRPDKIHVIPADFPRLDVGQREARGQILDAGP